MNVPVIFKRFFLNIYIIGLFGLVLNDHAFSYTPKAQK